MKTAASRKQLEQLADEVYGVTRAILALRARSKATGPEELSESEFITLDLLTKHETMTVGEIQKQIGIPPAQMSRLMRSLETKDAGAMVKCAINEQDRRKVDVTITEPGGTAHGRFREARRATALQFLQHLSHDDREVFMRILRSFRKEIDKHLL
ncbi:MAG TPA: helix-turn-helix domain-containing protein [Thermoguttaceae bacterium]|nr:helix-turn-helix domain-containing protein [Thermoguttaceae bacterium]HUU84784.1 helix-turn-helix domain-containing protein [Phycisphaerae bacterium]